MTVTLVGSAPSRFLALLVLAGVVVFWGLFGTGPAQVQAQQQQKYALLVGCTQYELPTIPELYGPANDVEQFAKLLIDDFGFPAEHIAKFAGWPDNPAERPTYRNITESVKKLIARAGPGTHIVILLAGHGVQVPIPASQKDPLDPKNPEPDGMDEVFLPADVQAWSQDTLKNAIRDDQIADWLQQLEDKGATVWIIFDCCHSGTMTRAVDFGKELPRENPRLVQPQTLKIPDAAIAAAARRAQAAVAGKQPKNGELTRSIGTTEYFPLENLKSKQPKGSVVAFYAAQPFETTPELPRPEDAPRVRKNYYGLFSYTLVQILKQRQTPMSYRQLGQAIVARYDAERGSRGPTPTFEGAVSNDLDQEVLGQQRWQTADILLLQGEDQLKVNAGGLRGLTTGSILAVYPPAGSKRDMKKPLGYVKVMKITPTAAEVEACAAPQEAQSKPVAAADLPHLGRCTLASRSFGEMQIKLAIHADCDSDKDAAKEVLRQMQAIGSEVQALFKVTNNEAEADWLLWIEKGQVYWRPGLGAKLGSEIQVKKNPRAVVQTKYGNYAVQDGLTVKLERDIQTIFTWRNVWRVAGTLASSGSTADYGVKLQVVKLGSAAGEQLRDGAPLIPGDRIAFQVANEGDQDVWITLLMLDANFGIRARTLPQLLQAGQSYGPIKGKIENAGSGKEGIVVLAVPKSVSRARPSFEFLDQVGLGTERDIKRDVLLAPPTPFGQLMKTAAIGRGTRAFIEDVPTNPAVLSFSWITLRPEAAAVKMDKN